MATSSEDMIREHRGSYTSVLETWVKEGTFLSVLAFLFSRTRLVHNMPFSTDLQLVESSLESCRLKCLVLTALNACVGR